MSKKLFRKPTYHVRRHDGKYYVFVDGYNTPITITKKPQGWYACTMYHKTLRDAIFYCLYGV